MNPVFHPEFFYSEPKKIAAPSRQGAGTAFFRYVTARICGLYHLQASFTAARTGIFAPDSTVSQPSRSSGTSIVHGSTFATLPTLG